MAIVMIMKWPGVSLEQYQQARDKVRWETDVPKGAQYHVAAHDGEAMRVVDVWDSEADFNSFVEKRLMPVVVGELGVTSQPQVEIFPAYATFNPKA